MLAVAALAVGVALSAVAGRDTRRPQPAPRSAGYAICPDVGFGTVRSYRLLDRKLQNLGENVMGRSLVFARDGRTFEVHVGYDAVDALEDVDFERVAELRAHGTTVAVLRAAALPFDRAPVAAVWEDDRFRPAACRELTVLAIGLPTAELADVVSKLRAEQP